MNCEVGLHQIQCGAHVNSDFLPSPTGVLAASRSDSPLKKVTPKHAETGDQLEKMKPHFLPTLSLQETVEAAGGSD